MRPILLSLSLLFALPVTPPSQEVFVDRARELGIDFVHVNGMSGHLYMPEVMGSGVAVLDYDNDGDLDILFVQGGPLGPEAPAGTSPGLRLYRNDLSAGHGLHFTDVTAESGLRGGGYGMGVAVGDFNNDGWPDLYITGLGFSQLWRNNGRDASGHVTFTEVTSQARAGDSRWSVSAAFFDYDRDGWLDLFVGNYLKFSFATHKPCRDDSGAPDYCGPVPADAQPDLLLHNRGDGTFEDVSQKAGITAAYGPALGVVTADLNGDGYQDVYVANDETPNQLWINQKNGTFRDSALLAGAGVSGEGRPQASMGVDAGDFDGKGREDLVMSNLTGEGNALYRNDGTGMFEDVSLPAGVRTPSWKLTGFGLSWLDYDNDSWLDLLVVNGAVRKSQGQPLSKDPLPLKQEKQLFHNLGNGRFEEVGQRSGAVFSLPTIGRGAAFGDLDNDGDTDVVISNNNGPAQVLINQIGNRRPWLGLRLLTGQPGRDALGAVVELHRPGKPVLRRRAHTDGSYASANDPRVLFGLGDQPKVEKVVVHWPSGRTEEWTKVAAGAYTTLREGTGAQAQGGAR